jgi:hypothetical protein
MISPDMGWANRDAMVSWANERTSQWWLSDLEQVAEEPQPIKNPDTLIFKHMGVNYKLPRAAVDLLGAGLHYWRYDDGLAMGPIQSFHLVRAAGAVVSLPGRRDRIIQ